MATSNPVRPLFRRAQFSMTQAPTVEGNVIQVAPVVIEPSGKPQSIPHRPIMANEHYQFPQNGPDTPSPTPALPLASGPEVGNHDEIIPLNVGAPFQTQPRQPVALLLPLVVPGSSGGANGVQKLRPPSPWDSVTFLFVTAPGAAGLKVGYGAGIIPVLKQSRLKLPTRGIEEVTIENLDATPYTVYYFAAGGQSENIDYTILV